jgi:hypothetical protein
VNEYKSPVQKKNKRSNAEKCKEFRERKRENKINLTAELENEMKKNTSLKNKTRRLEDKVAKFKKILLKNSTKQKIKMSDDTFYS